MNLNSKKSIYFLNNDLLFMSKIVSDMAIVYTGDYVPKRLLNLMHERLESVDKQINNFTVCLFVEISIIYLPQRRDNVQM